MDLVLLLVTIFTTNRNSPPENEVKGIGMQVGEAELRNV